MKKALLLFVGLILLAPAAVHAASASVPDPVKGRDWIVMTTQEKEKYLTSAIGFLQAKGIPLQHPAPYYGQALNILVDQKGAEKAFLVDLLTSIIYKDDPRARAVLDKMRKLKKEKSA